MSNTGSLSAGIGLISSNATGDVIEVFYPSPVRGIQAAEFELITAATELHPDRSGYEVLGTSQTKRLSADFRAAGLTDWANLLEQADNGQWLVCFTFDQTPPANIPEAFLKLHLLSHRLCKPHEQNLDGLFGTLKNLAWTNEGPISRGPAGSPSQRPTAR